MTSITFNSAAITQTQASVSPAEKPSLFASLVEAIMTSRKRKTDIEIRRMRAVVEDTKLQLDYALLPFAGE